MTRLSCILTLAALAAPALAAEVSIEHSPAPCFAPNEWPRIEARLLPATARQTVRVVFRAADSSSWYAVDLAPTQDGLVGALPRPRVEIGRVSYFFESHGDAGSARLPETSAFVVDVRAGCSTQPAKQGPIYLGLVGNAPQPPEGFDTKGIQGYVEGGKIALPSVAPAATPSEESEGWLLPAQARVRVRTVAPGTLAGRVVRSGERMVTVQPEGGGDPVTLLEKGRTLEGRVVRSDAKGVILSVKGQPPVRLRHEDLVSVEYRKKGSAAVATVGVLGGMAGGAVAAVLVCVAADACNSSGPVWAGMIAGGVLGGLGGGVG